jgi:Family of unknown function (DUF6314)
VEPDEVGRYHGTAGKFRSAERAPDRPGPDGAGADGAGLLVPGLRVPDALDFLRGRWQIERRIADHAAGSSGTFDGMARFEALGVAALTYHEHGELQFGGHRGPASRSLIYRRRPDGTADVCFADGREFYRLDPRSGRWQGQHECGRDLYTVAGELLGAGKFQERWRARGPDKDYVITTILVRT